MDRRSEIKTDMAAAKNNQVSPNIQEDKVTRAIENQTAKIPSVGYLGLAFGASPHARRRRAKTDHLPNTEPQGESWQALR